MRIDINAGKRPWQWIFYLTIKRGKMKSHMLLMREVLKDMGTRCCTSTNLDWKTIEMRVEKEGLSFLTITLPQFAKDLEKGLALSAVDPSTFAGFTKVGYLPRFLGGFTGRIFDSRSGCLLDSPCVDSIYAVRQICLLFSKVNLPCSDARIAKAIAKYVECEKEVKENDRTLNHSDYAAFKRMAIFAWSDVLAELDFSIYNQEIVPRHGPGSTADRLIGNNKYRQQSWPSRLDEYFPYQDFALPNVRYSQEYLPLVDFLEPGSEVPVKVITVPKTLKTPRIIAVEPTAMQYAQQGLMATITRAIEGDELLSQFVGFKDQNPNRVMARQGSLDGSLATLDLSEASDRVSNQLVRALLAYYPHVSGAVDACRSRKARVPGHGVIRLAKFASMGSALCFPMEAMVFFTIILLGIEQDYRHPLSRRDLIDLVGKVRVYGDDIVVPVEHVQSVVEKLETFGFQVNSNKSFWTGKFRESCGKEYYDGVDVSVVKVRAMLPSQRQHVTEIISTVSLRNQLYFAGNWGSARFLDSQLERLIPFPLVLETSPALGRHSFLRTYMSEKVCRYLHRDLVRACVESSVPPPSHLDGPFALLKVFLKQLSRDSQESMEPTIDDEHLERAGRPKSSNIKLRWVPPY